MTGNTQSYPTTYNRMLEVAQEEFQAFERKESEFRKKLREERAAELPLPLAIRSELLN